jgi:hypothetical protein
MVSYTCGLLPNPAKVPNYKYKHYGTLSIGNFMLMMKKPKNLEFEPVHPKNVLLASVVHGISCLFDCFLVIQELNSVIHKNL